MRTMLAAAALALCSGAALGADGASYNIIGYSPDNRFFAFEQYGTQDGSGFSYWDVFILDLKTNQWVKDTPVKALIEDETAKLSAARTKAHAAADPLLAQAGIAEPAVIIAANPATEVVAERSRIAFDRWYRPMGATPATLVATDMRHEISVEAVKLPDPKGCYDADGPYFGFSLTLKDVKLDSAHAFYSDETIPASRGCPIAYDMAAIVAPGGFPEEDRMVAIVGVYAHGFEGANQRFVAVPFVLSD
jgi:predicted secreted protein